jgi:Ca2+-binding EF-hand superfamily protein
MVDVEAADRKLQDIIRARGGSGIVGISRNFRIIDVDRSGHLNRVEFGRAIALFRAGLSEAEADALFKKYDSDKSGSISIDEYLKGMRGKISKTRLALVNRIYATMDADRSGVLTVEDMKLRYNAKGNPDVQSKKKTEEQVLTEFLNTFEGEGGERGDGQVTRQEFVDYYVGVSSNIDSDDHFLMLICNVWNFPYAPLSKVQEVIRMLQTKTRTIVKGNETEEKTLIKQFKIIDSNNSGEVDMDEFKVCMINMGILSPAADKEDITTVELLFVLFDADASGALSYKEFAHAVLHYEF